jgi:thiamine biosynthesis lipoprotein
VLSKDLSSKYTKKIIHTLCWSALIIVLISTIAFKRLTPLRAYHINGYAQGTTFKVTYFAPDSFVTKKNIDSILNGIDSSLSLYKPYSLINKFNNSGRGVTADWRLQAVTRKSIEIFKQTSGIFDITVKPLVAAWGFGVTPGNSIPSKESIKAILKCVGSGNIWLQGDSLVKDKACIHIDLNGIAQGYSVDLLAERLEEKGIYNYLVEIGGELRVKGRKQPGGDEFIIGIEGPAKNSFSDAAIQKIVKIKEGAITTSGNYRNYRKTGLKNISHLIDPRTGLPIDTDLVSVTVYSTDAMTADGFDNALMGMGMQNAIKFVEQQHNMEAYFIYKTPGGIVYDTATTGFYKLLQ